MRERALLVERRRGEQVRQELVAHEALRTDLAIRDEGIRLAFPLRPGAEVLPSWGEVDVRDFEPRSSDGPAEFRDLLPWTDAEKELLPRSFDIVGEIVLVRLSPELEARREEVGAALLRFVPGVRLVGLDRGVRGAERRRAVERIAGEGAWSTRHRENRLEFDVDVERAYFSPRLAREHANVAAEVRQGDGVYDLCCGVGPFSVTIARDGRARSIVAVDVNPVAISLLRSTLARYAFGSRVLPREEALEAFVVSAPPVERVVLNLPHEGIKYAGPVARLVAPGGRLTYYEILRRDEIAGRGAVVERTLADAGPFRVSELRIVHPYSPSSDLVAVVADRRPE
jgi:tRNA (guanine37-N1)-methyltransferase